MNRRTVLILAVIFTILTVITLVQGMTGDQPEPLAIFQRVFADLDPAQIDAVQLQDPNGGATLTLSRDASGLWTAPGQTGTLNPQAGERIAQTIVLLPYERIVPLPPAVDYASYGFNPNGRLLVQAVMADGSTHVVAVGSLTPTGETYYALVDNRDGIYLLARGAVDFLLNQLETPPIA